MPVVPGLAAPAVMMSNCVKFRPLSGRSRTWRSSTIVPSVDDAVSRATALEVTAIVVVVAPSVSCTS